ncbi:MULTISPECIES: class II fructose-bisphosphatase [unclassified Arthrobacter]|uniref:class II fructose-bisphosphatase n=1 Tax=unclassified Arthrobacter TaxID=235627 RepID=UPI001D14AFC6|nr:MULTISPECIES: class II fructose-bisphosphatase [unclassified Arthrobacter]MCC3291989.1 class II fructose-bisphosphatase [Arthrobacter sp. zg-Y1110]MCC3302887.1 class II fructose-bisphosphatase [Arthrobacter sp. zg-Y895]MCQ1947791.1 class II fructose-bisphosphatase [Arthrobacter sp. zg-Y1116]MCQ1987734.1 class II fructose-bisphosphatase [Arthrobacter sp. zg-Y844]MCQ1996305.1 class II fructose-bisphosphatase [Arthrobacter sp. zg-Y1171]
MRFDVSKGAQYSTLSPALAVGDSEPDRNLALELVRVTEAAAIAGGHWVGFGDKNAADGAAVDAMRSLISTVHFNGVVVIGEGEKDEAPMLYNGEYVGDGTGALCDVAVDPIDGTRLTALGINNALAVLAVAERGTMFDPSAVFYMEKLVTGPEAADMVDLRLPVKQNLHLIAKAKGKKINQLNVMILERDRHKPLVQEIRDAGARTRMLMDGDVAGGIAAAREGTDVDALMGIGGTPEGIITACAIKTLGGVIQGRLWPTSDDEKQKAIDAGHDLDRVMSTNDLVTSDNCYFAATGITDGDLLRGVRYKKDRVLTQSIVMRSKSGTIRVVDGEHQAHKWESYARSN